ncbi:uncharacterized protein LOC121422118 [Lytechinus variegatus]|uniref:uncharacterized protein LOC121422118 n=1 Tax=Lytechinus variegatus TaxID=7654 RepID=UPI001BB28320|nr:uncharacterized protein LOC121422118 [Lytechinus variegatus]
MARSGHEEEVFFSACLSPSDCYVTMAPISGTSESSENHTPATEKSEERPAIRPLPAQRRRRISHPNRHISSRFSRVMSPTRELVSDRVESTYDNLDLLTEPKPQPQSQYESPPLRIPDPRRAVESQYENVVLRPPRLSPRLPPRASHAVLTQHVTPQPALPIRTQVKELHKLQPQKDRRYSKNVSSDIQQQLEGVVMRRKDPISRNPQGPRKITAHASHLFASDPVFPGFKKTGAIDFDARIYRCNEISRENIGKQSLVMGEENFACAYVNHLGGYLKLMRLQATLFIPPHAILGDPEPVVLYFMAKTNQVGYSPLVGCLQPDQFLVSPIMYIGKPGFKYSTVDVVLSFPMDESHSTASFFSVLTVKSFDTAFSSENSKWRILAPGHDYFFTVCGGRGVLMVSQSAFYVIRATKAAPEYQNLAIPRDTSKRKIRVALFGRSLPESNRAKLHVVFCKDCDQEVERVIESEKRDSFRKLDHVRALSIQTSSGQPIWVSFCQLKNTSWILQTSSTAKFTPDELFNYADPYPPSVTFALSNPTTNLMSADAFVQCMVVVHEGSSANYQDADVTTFVQLVGDVTVAKSGQFQSQSLGRASAKRLPMLTVPQTVVTPPSSDGSGQTSISSHSSQISSDCTSVSPQPVPDVDRKSVVLLNSYDAQSDTSKARFEDIYVSYKALAELCLMLQASMTGSSEKDWMTFATKIGLSMEQVDRMSDRYNFQSPLSIIHLFFGTCPAATSCCPSTSPREKARALLVRLISVFQEMKRDDLTHVVRRELTRIDQEIDRYSKFLFEGGQFEIRTNVGGAVTTNRTRPRHSFSDGDVTVLTPSAESFKGRLNDIVCWFKSKSSDVFKFTGSSKETTAEQIYEVPRSNFSVFEDGNTYEALVPLKGRKNSNSDKRKEKAKQNEYN